MPEVLNESIPAAFFRDRMLFLGMPDEELAVVAGMARAMRFHDGELVFREGDDDRTLYLIAEGEVEILQRSPSGESHCTNTLRAWNSNDPLLSQYEGDFFGEMAMVDSEPRNADARAKGELTVYALAEDGLHALAGEHTHLFSALVLNIARILSRRLRQSTRRQVMPEDGRQD